MATIDEILQKLNENRRLIQDRFHGLDARLRHIEGNFTGRFVSIPGLEDQKEKFSILRIIRAMRSGNWDEAPFEREIMKTVEKTMGTMTGPAGGFIVPDQYMAEIIELLAAKAVVIGMGATVLNGLSGGEVIFPRQTGGATVYWVAEGADITPSDLTLGQLILRPKAVAALVKVSNRLIKLANPSAEALVRNDITKAIARAVDLASLRGPGVENQPLGIANTSGIGTIAIGTDGGDFLFEHMVDMEGQLEDNNALEGRLGVVWSGKVKRKLKKMRIPQWSGDTGGQYVMLPMTDAMLRDHLGYDFATSTQIPTDLTKGSGTNLSEVYFGNWEELLIGQWGGLEILASQETSDAFQKNQTWVRVILEVDVGLRHPESFCLCSDAATT